MKVQCDVCEKAEASVMCCADEAALCTECDSRVHAANKLAGKHQRVNLLYPESEDLPCCDICQDKVGYFFCLEDRALLCRSCDYSIHSTNALAAKHKRFLVSGIRVALQALLTTNEGAESIQECTSSQISLSTKVSQKNSPEASSLSKTSQLSSGVMRTQECQRIVPSSSPIPQQSPPLYAEKIPTHEQTENRGTNAASVEPEQLQKVMPMAASTGEVMVVLPSNLAAVPVNPDNHQVHFNSDWEMHPSIGGVHPHNVSAMTSQRGGGGFVRRNSISEYLMETIPGWRVDELLSLTDAMSTRSFTDCGSSKTDIWNYGDTDWQTDYNSVEDMIPAQGPAEVPSIPSPPTYSGIPRSVKTWGLGKYMKPSDLDGFLEYDNAPVVPDIGGVTSPPAQSPSSQPQKRQRTAMNF